MSLRTEVKLTHCTKSYTRSMFRKLNAEEYITVPSVYGLELQGMRICVTTEIRRFEDVEAWQLFRKHPLRAHYRLLWGPRPDVLAFRNEVF
jgi:hypothetical protein